MRVSVIIPTYQAAPYIAGLLRALQAQSHAPHEIMVMDSSSTDGTAAIVQQAAIANVQFQVIPKTEFNHGGTRTRAAKRVTGDVLVFMTQDAQPANEHYLAELIKPIMQHQAVACFARQLPYPHASASEQFARGFNYPAVSRINTQADVATRGVKAYFYSDVASAIRSDIFWQMGGYADDVIISEDMLLAAKLLQQGYATAYVADAQVYHSHDYTFKQQFQRYFDIGVFFKARASDLAGAKTGGEGLRFALSQLRFLCGGAHYGQALRVLGELPLKWLGFRLGMWHSYLPLWLIKKCSMHSFYWS